jgi:NADPH:quinone reductase-like Zn-dependent oxidoreductase
MSPQAIQVSQYGGADVLHLAQVQHPQPQAGEVLVRVYAAGVNPVDWKIRAGWMKDFHPMNFPYIPGMDIAGVVEEVGPGVTAFQKGQAVFGQAAAGAYAEYTTASVQKLTLKPESLSFDEAAAIPIGATTAWQGLFDYGKLEAGQRVLVQGAAGGVGLFAVQFARWKGAQVIGTASTSNVEFVRSLGVETVIDYTKTQVEQAVHDVDLVFDGVGGDALKSSVQAVKQGGRLVTIAGQPPEDQVKARTIQVSSFAAQVSAELLHTFAQLIQEGKVKVVIAKTYPLSEARQAQQESESGHGRGRIVLHIAG